MQTVERTERPVRMRGPSEAGGGDCLRLRTELRSDPAERRNKEAAAAAASALPPRSAPRAGTECPSRWGRAENTRLFCFFPPNRLKKAQVWLF